MTDKTNLLLALNQVDNLEELLKDNEYKDYIYGRLAHIRAELKRQLSHYG
jgi:hypothetical protein